MTIAITGGAGFVGRRLLARLGDSGQTLRALQNKTPLPDQPGMTPVQGRLDDDSALSELVAGADTLVHLAGCVAAPRGRDFHAVNAGATGRLVAAARDAGVKRVLLISSLAARRPEISAYAASKYGGEQALQQGVDADMGWDILRPPAIYGPGDTQVLTFFKCLQKGIALMPGGREARLSLLYVDDLARAIQAWIDERASTQEIYEIDDAAEGGHSWPEIMQTGAAELGVHPRYIIPPYTPLMAYAYAAQGLARLSGKPPLVSPGKVRELTCKNWVARDTSRFCARFGFTPAFDLTSGLAETLRWYRGQGWLAS